MGRKLFCFLLRIYDSLEGAEAEQSRVEPSRAESSRVESLFLPGKRGRGGRERRFPSSISSGDFFLP